MKHETSFPILIPHISFVIWNINSKKGRFCSNVNYQIRLFGLEEFDK